MLSGQETVQHQVPSEADEERVVHVGCGTGYYSAVLANVVSDHGSLIALEIEPERSRHNLAYLPQVRVVCANGSAYGFSAISGSPMVVVLPFPEMSISNRA